MGNVSRVAIPTNTQDVSTLRRSHTFMKAATPALVLSAAVLFSAGAHAAESAPVQAGKAVQGKVNAKAMSATSTFDKEYADIKKARVDLAKYRSDIDKIDSLHAQSEHAIAQAIAEKKRIEEGAERIALLEKNIDAAVKEYKSFHADRPDSPKMSDLNAMTAVDFASIQDLGLENKLGEKSDDFLALIQSKRAELTNVHDVLSDVEKHAAVWRSDLVNARTRLEAEDGYIDLVEMDHHSPRGVGSLANPNGGWAGGDLANAAGVESTAFGTGAEAIGDHSSAFGYQAKAVGSAASAFGKNAKADGHASSAVGYSAQAKGVGATAIGVYAVASGPGATAVGTRSMANTGGTAIGASAYAVDGATAIGAGAVANAKGAVAIGKGVVNTEADTVAFANGDGAKRLTHVAEGKHDTDAVNVKQIRESAQGMKSTLRAEMDVSSQRAIAQSNSYTDQKVTEIRKDMAAMDKSFRRGIASSAALMMAAPYAPGKVAVTAGTALYRATPALAVGASYWNESGKWNVNGGISTAGSNSTIIRLGGSMLF